MSSLGRLLVFVFILLLSACATKDKATGGYGGHGLDSIDEKTLAEFAPPALSGEKLRRIQGLLDVRSPSAGALSPDNKSLFISWNVTGTSQIWKVPGPMQYPIQMTGGEDASRLLEITPDGKYLVIGRDEKGNEYPGLFLQSTEGGELKPIYRKKKVQVFLGFVTADSKSLYFRANDRNPKSYAIYKYNIESGEKSLVFEVPVGYWFIADHFCNDLLLLANWKGNTSSEYYLYDVKTKTQTPVFGQGENEEYSARFGATKDQLIVLTNRFSEYRKVFLWQKGKFTAITSNETYDIDSIDTDRQKTKAVLRVNKGGYYSAKAMNLKSLKVFDFFKSDDANVLHVYPGSFSQDGKHISMYVVKANEPGVGMIHTLGQDGRGRSRIWTRSSAPEVSLNGLVTPKLEYYTARDGTKIPMFVQRPPQCEDKVCPVVVQFHGGPESQAIPRFSPIRQMYFENNFIFVEPNVRGSDGYGKSWLHSDNGPKRLDVITDIEDAAKFIKKNWAKWGKEPKVAVMGGSYGGYSAFIAMTKFAGAYDAGIAVVGMSSLLTFLQNTAPYRRALRVTEYGDPEKDLEALKKLSALTYLDRLKAPMLIIHGATDPRVPAGEAIQVYRAMQQKQLPGQLVLFPDEGHGIRKRRNRALYLGYIFDFLAKNL
jgi:dipeptidyl aminopeptidase/acylaminoacyl peptidase